MQYVKVLWNKITTVNEHEKGKATVVQFPTAPASVYSLQYFMYSYILSLPGLEIVMYSKLTSVLALHNQM